MCLSLILKFFHISWIFFIYNDCGLACQKMVKNYHVDLAVHSKNSYKISKCNNKEWGKNIPLCLLLRHSRILSLTYETISVYVLTLELGVYKNFSSVHSRHQHFPSLPPRRQHHKWLVGPTESYLLPRLLCTGILADEDNSNATKSALGHSFNYKIKLHHTNMIRSGVI